MYIQEMTRMDAEPQGAEATAPLEAAGAGFRVSSSEF
jgi:hypothetical protein